MWVRMNRMVSLMSESVGVSVRGWALHGSL